MIRINLLPFRAARKRENIKRQITVYILSVILLLVAMVYAFLQLDTHLSELQAEEKDLRGDLAKYEDTIKRINEMSKQIALIEKKLEVIRSLERRKTGPVRLLDEISKAVPEERLWLSALVESGASLSLEGSAQNNETLAEFMVNLESSPFIKTVDLESSRSDEVEGVNVSTFTLQCRTYSFEEESGQEAGEAKKRRSKK
ncbi:MAG: PilN domain-containing protein [Desulfobacteraceae bacterium]